MASPARYYLIDTIPAKPVYFRVSDGGRYDRWDAPAKAWVHVSSPDARDYFSRAIENGDAWPVKAGDVPGR